MDLFDNFIITRSENGCTNGVKKIKRNRLIYKAIFARMALFDYVGTDLLSVINTSPSRYALNETLFSMHHIISLSVDSDSG